MRTWMILFLFGCTEDSPDRIVQALVSDGMVVSQLYGGGGNPGANWHNDYVELFNRGTSAVDMGGWSLQYGSTTANFNLRVDIPAATLVQPNRYFLISLGSSGSHGATVPADLVGTGSGAFNISGADGKVAIVNNQTPLGCGGSNRCSSASIIDMLGYGQGTDYEGTASSSPVGVNGALYRAGEGCVDSDDNSADFAGGTATPRNGSTALHDCKVDLFGVDTTAPPDLLPEPDLSGGDLASGQPPGGGRVVISQFYGSGGDSGASFRNDFVELFNRSAIDQEVSGWSLQYASKDNTFALKVDIPADTVIPAGGYFLIRLSSGGGSGVTVADPDLLVNMPQVLNISAASGKLALVDSGTLQVCGTAANRCSSTAIVDLVGYGVASDFEDAPAATFNSADDSLFRKQDGCQDTDHNDQDFFSAAAAPRNSGTAVHLCAQPVVDAGAADDAAAADDGGADAAAPQDAAVVRDLAVQLPPGDDFGMPDDLSVNTKARATSGCGCDLGGAGGGGGLWWALALFLYAVRAAASTRPPSERSSEMANPSDEA